MCKINFFFQISRNVCENRNFPYVISKFKAFNILIIYYLINKNFRLYLQDSNGEAGRSGISVALYVTALATKLQYGFDSVH